MIALHLANKWNSNNTKQNTLWIMWSGAPLLTDPQKAWHFLPEYTRQRLMDYVEDLRK